MRPFSAVLLLTGTIVQAKACGSVENNGNG